MHPKLDCPCCGQTAMSGLTKGLLGPMRTVKCQSCGERVSIPYMSLVYTLPFVVLMVIGISSVSELNAKLFFLAIGTAITTLLTLFIVPIEGR